MKQREYRILELLTERKRIEVAALAREIGVSQVTVRKDLDALEEKGVIHREHGWAVLCSPDDLNGRIAYHYEAKRRIAARAAELVRDGETVMIESGSCCALLADALTGAGRDVTIITNSAFIAGYVRRKPGAKVICTVAPVSGSRVCLSRTLPLMLPARAVMAERVSSKIRKNSFPKSSFILIFLVSYFRCKDAATELQP